MIKVNIDPMILPTIKLLYLILVSERILFIWKWIDKDPNEIKIIIKIVLITRLSIREVLYIPLVRSNKPLIIT